MSETYTIGGNALQQIQFGNETAQSFSPVKDHILDYIDMDVFLNDERGIPVPHLYNADFAHEPFGGTASHTISQTYTKPFKPGLQRLRSQMEPYPIEVGKNYCIKIYGLGTAPEYTFYWQYDQDTATYPRGHRIWRNTKDDPYTHYHDQDYMFCEFGRPPLPKPDPPPPIDYFATTDIVYFPHPTTVTITLATSVPCHLLCFYTEKMPLRHPTERVIRGATLPWGAYFCFVAWKMVEQTEPGDTLYHTFEIPDWVYCQTKWFTFRGAIAEELAPWSDEFKQEWALFYEPWGTILNENYPWIPAGDPGPPTWTLIDGILTLDFKNTKHSGITYNPPYNALTLQSDEGSPCFIYADIPGVRGPATGELIVHGFQLRKGDFTCLLYLTSTMTSEGAFSTPYGFAFVEGKMVGWMYVGTGIHQVNLLAFFQDLRAYFHLSPDPEGWWFSFMELAHRCWYAPPESWLKSNTLAVYYPPRKTFDELASPSIGPIFKYHHPGALTTVDIGVSYKAYYRYAASANPGDPDVLYNLAHGQELALSYYPTVGQYGQQVRVIGTYAYAMIRRMAIMFNTGMLPPCTLLQAVLRLDMRKVAPPPGYGADFDWFLKVRAGQDLNAEITHPDLKNYSKILALGTQIGAKYADDLPDPGNQDYWYIDVPLEYINLDGFTVITSLTDKDEEGYRPDNNKAELALFIANTSSILHIAYYKH